MPIVSLNCQNCGANLDVPDGARFIKCNYCDSSLEVKSDGGATYTIVKEKLDRIEKKTDHIEQRVDSLHLQREIDNLDLQWERRSRRLMMSNKHGRQYVPKVYHAYLSGAASVLMGVIWFSWTNKSGMSDHIMLFGVLIFAVGVLMAFYIYSRARKYETERLNYERRRAELRRGL